MPVGRIADKIIPEVFNPYVFLKTMELSAFIQSGIMVENPLLNMFLAGGGMTTNVPSNNDIPNDDANISSDDPTVFSAPNKIGSNVQLAIRLSRNQSWSEMDLAAALAGNSSMTDIGNNVAGYWSRQIQKAGIAALTGVVADNVANDNNDYVNDISGLAAPLNLFSGEHYIDTLQTLGDASSQVSAIAVHSVVNAQMKKNNLIDYIPDSQGVVQFPTFQGARIIVDDALFTGAGATLLFQSYLFGPGVLQLGRSQPLMPFEPDRVSNAGNGAGQDIMHSRVEWIVHPTGHTYTGDITASGGPSNPVMSVAASWDRVFPERKQIQFAVMVSKG